MCQDTDDKQQQIEQKYSFENDGGHTFVTKTSSHSLDTNPAVVLVETRHRQARRGGGTFTRLRQTSDYRVKTSLSSPTDLLAQQLVRVIESDAGNSPIPRKAWLRLLPSRLPSSPILCDAVLLFSNCWDKSLQNTSISPFDHHAYQKALGSLRPAIESQPSLDTPTAAAILLLQSSEFYFNLDREASQVKHMAGLQAIISIKGLPSPLDELDLHLFCDSVGTIVLNMILDGDDDAFRGPRIVNAMHSALHEDIETQGISSEQYRLCLFTIYWCKLASSLRRVIQASAIDSTLTLMAEAKEVADALVRFEEEKLAPILADRTKIWTVPDDSVPGGFAYQFSDESYCELLLTLVTINIPVCQILLSTCELLALPGYHLSQRLQKLSKRMWMSIPYVQSRSLAQQGSTVVPLILSLEHANSAWSDSLVRTIVEFLGPRSVFLPPEPTDFLLDHAMRLTGRAPT
ncbi:unnamed protein product [Clonostachys byssicola]|uniref:Uncharacterized protein n=1 Tax=Clonostachys byssicola TaxID=160290 RepID=A0A9N9XZ77_9HYPO|nr:unnamed protein product [Clonostachys byssicola]